MQPETKIPADMQHEIEEFFRQFALRLLMQAHADPNNPQQVKMALIDHFEEIFPAFSLTAVYQEHAHSARREQMIEVYKACFTQLLMGRLP
jgi:hypothetical protein